MAQGSTFVVRLNGIKLPAAAEAQLSRAVQAAAMAELAKLNLRDTAAFKIPKGTWRGIWIDRVRDIKIPDLRVVEGR